MVCPICNREMKKGTATFLCTSGFSPVVLNFTSDSDKDKSIFAREDTAKTVIQGIEYESFYCEHCKAVLPIIK